LLIIAVILSQPLTIVVAALINKNMKISNVLKIVNKPTELLNSFEISMVF
jgi:hypothetical protein